MTIDESDWKHLRQLHKVALERFSKQILEELDKIRADSSKNFHERFLASFDLINHRNKDIAMAFDDPSRSRAIAHLGVQLSLGLLTKNEFAGFTQQTQEIMKRHLGNWHA
ncbi:hypothetical protein [Geothrix sp. SG200]|uniref:hypothetical protein n=1 Tax=Geothrix sp. SG200 TaxID=2922865 RepID=UPI001FAC3424|nr:hypothetical protein [Geothrix sp. SG200]